MAVGLRELCLSGASCSGSSWTWVAPVTASQPVPVSAQGKKRREKQDGEWLEEKGAKEEEE